MLGSDPILGTHGTFPFFVGRIYWTHVGTFSEILQCSLTLVVYRLNRVALISGRAQDSMPRLAKKI